MSEQFSGRVTVVDNSGREVFRFDSQFAVLDLGALDNEGDLRLRGDDGETKIHLDGGRQLINVTNAAGVTMFRFDAALARLNLGPSVTAGAAGDLRIFGSDGEPKIQLDAASDASTTVLAITNGVLSDALTGVSNSGHGVFGVSQSNASAVRGESALGVGVSAQTVAGPHIIEAFSANDLRFRVRRDGAVLADGPFTGPADFAEMLPAAGSASEYEPGDVLVIGKDGRLVLAAEPQATTVAGVYSSNSGFVGDTRIKERGLAEFENSQGQIGGETWLMIALVGVVPVKVSAENGAIRPGDLLVSSGTPGHAMLARPIQLDGVDIYPTGAIIGKALEPLESGQAHIKSLLTLQ